jgi:hypothetical protein
MSATTEILYAEIRTVERALNEATSQDEIELLKARLSNLRSQFVRANESLNENRQVLKG